jgi:hypothetical protein
MLFVFKFVCSGNLFYYLGGPADADYAAYFNLQAMIRVKMVILPWRRKGRPEDQRADR